MKRRTCLKTLLAAGAGAFACPLVFSGKTEKSTIVATECFSPVAIHLPDGAVIAIPKAVKPCTVMSKGTSPLSRDIQQRAPARQRANLIRVSPANIYGTVALFSSK